MVAAAAAAGSHPELQALLVEPTWRLKLAPELAKPSAQQLQKFLQQEWAQHKVFPPQHTIFRCVLGAVLTLLAASSDGLRRLVYHARTHRAPVNTKDQNLIFRLKIIQRSVKTALIRAATARLSRDGRLGASCQGTSSLMRPSGASPLEAHSPGAS